MDKVILHIDMNNFYASIETLFHPEYKNVPMAVAGNPKNRHGIILAKNPIAKEFGIKTAETVFQAQRKCPNLVLLPPHFEHYHAFSQSAKNIYLDYTDQVESFGLDECWLDVTGSLKIFESGEYIAETIRNRVKNELGLTVSIGLSFNKTFAKLGSDYNKYDAITVFSKDTFKNTVWKLPITDLLFVGKHTAERLHKIGIYTIGDMAQSDLMKIQKTFGKMGAMLWKNANGLDSDTVSPISAPTTVKTIGNSMTLAADIWQIQDVRKNFLSLAETVSARLRHHDQKCREVQISIRTSEFTDIQRQCRIEPSASDSYTLFRTAMKLYEKERKNLTIRGLGLRAGHLESTNERQTSLFMDNLGDNRQDLLESAVDSLRDKYGTASVKKAIFLENTD